MDIRKKYNTAKKRAKKLMQAGKVNEYIEQLLYAEKLRLQYIKVKSR